MYIYVFMQESRIRIDINMYFYICVNVGIFFGIRMEIVGSEFIQDEGGGN